MLLLISPAKTLDFETPAVTRSHSQPAFLEESQVLIEQLRRMSPDGVGALMSISDTLAELNHARYMNWHRPFTPRNAKAAVLAFQGDVYTGLQAEQFSAAEFDYAQQHLRILSGLYGLLRPLDLIQPYRLEMGTRLHNPRGPNLYSYWGDHITRALNHQLEALGSRYVVNLASQEYFKAVQTSGLNAEVVSPVFKDRKGEGYGVISFYAKKARGMMAAWALRNRLQTPAELQAFAEAGYRFDPDSSTPHGPVFLRDVAQS
ncbi:MAG: peroxide stress protein YaaA [Spongiibacteraceae bacterium]|nr:peroxide stress protein YaaA [Spongiibacteraceae bacterium]